MNALMIPTTAKTMSSKEIAELTGKQHAHVLRDIRVMLDTLYPDMDRIESKGIIVSTRHDNGQTESISLPKRETLILVSGYNIQMRAKIIDRWQELEDAPTSTQLPAQVAHTFIKAELDMALLFGVPTHLAQVEAVKAAKMEIGYDASRFLLLAPAQSNIPTEEQRLEPTELGKVFGVSAVKMNRMLEAAGLQKKVGLNWEAVGDAKLHSSSHQWVSGNKSGYNLKWNVAYVRRVLFPDTVTE